MGLADELAGRVSLNLGEIDRVSCVVFTRLLSNGGFALVH